MFVEFENSEASLLFSRTNLQNYYTASLVTLVQQFFLTHVGISPKVTLHEGF